MNGLQRREEKQTGLGETSVQNWDESKETDISKQQIMRERKIANQQQNNQHKARKAPQGLAPAANDGNTNSSPPTENKFAGYRRTVKQAE